MRKERRARTIKIERQELTAPGQGRDVKDSTNTTARMIRAGRGRIRHGH